MADSIPRVPSTQLEQVARNTFNAYRPALKWDSEFCLWPASFKVDGDFPQGNGGEFVFSDGNRLVGVYRQADSGVRVIVFAK